jgi:hypothetical protein
VASESNRQPLMEEWISTQAQASVDDWSKLGRECRPSNVQCGRDLAYG